MGVVKYLARKHLVFVFLFSIINSPLSFFLQGFRSFTEACLRSEGLQRFFSFCSCESIPEDSRKGSLLFFASVGVLEFKIIPGLKLGRVWPVRNCIYLFPS